MRLKSKLSACAAAAIMCAITTGCSEKQAQSERPSSSASGQPNAATAAFSVSDWGPHATRRGEIFNAQPTNKAAIWIAYRGTVLGPKARVLFDGRPLEDLMISPGVVTAAVPASYYAEPGAKEVTIEDETGRRFPVGTFHVE